MLIITFLYHTHSIRCTLAYPKLNQYVNKTPSWLLTVAKPRVPRNNANTECDDIQPNNNSRGRGAMCPDRAAVVILPRDISEVGLCWGSAVAGVGEPHLQILLHTLKEMSYRIVWSLIGTWNITVVLEVYGGHGHWITEGSVTSVVAAVAVAAGWFVHRSGHLA